MKITEAEDVTFVSLLPKTQHKKHRRKRGLRHVMLGITLLGASPKMLLLGFWLFCEGIFAKTPKPRTYKGWRERRKNRGVILKGKCGGSWGKGHLKERRETQDSGPHQQITHAVLCSFCACGSWYSTQCLGQASLPHFQCQPDLFSSPSHNS